MSRSAARLGWRSKHSPCDAICHLTEQRGTETHVPATEALVARGANEEREHALLVGGRLHPCLGQVERVGEEGGNRGRRAAQPERIAALRFDHRARCCGYGVVTKKDGSDQDLALFWHGTEQYSGVLLGLLGVVVPEPSISDPERCVRGCVSRLELTAKWPRTVGVTGTDGDGGRPRMQRNKETASCRRADGRYGRVESGTDWIGNGNGN